MEVTDINVPAKLYLLLVFEWRGDETWDFRNAEQLVYQHSRYPHLVKPIPQIEVRGLRGKHTGGCLPVGSRRPRKITTRPMAWSVHSRGELTGVRA
jgi:hypothetical protein